MLNISKTLSDNPEEVDAILITGNFIHPDFMKEVKTPEEFDYKWAVIKEIIANTTKQIERKFPGKPILPVFGPNDNLGGENEAPENINLKLLIFDQIFAIWFESLPNKSKIYS